jgi:hypothetical protein
MGHQSLTSNTSGLQNSSFGYQSQYFTSSGNYNTSVGASALYNNSQGVRNTVVGNAALYNNTTGNYNVAFGDSTGNKNIVGSFNTFIGTGTTSTMDVSYSTAIGYNATATKSNQIMVGTSLESVNIQGNVIISNTQDATGSDTGALVVQGGAGIQGNLYVKKNMFMTGVFVGGTAFTNSGVIPNTSSFIEYMTGITYSSGLSVSFNTNIIYYVSGTPTPITSLTITSLPTTALTSFTFTFILATTSSLNYITATTATINGTSYNILGTVTVGTPVGYIIQQFTVFNTSSTSTPNYAIITSANAF